ncbi:MAG: hypothetical protein WKF57_04370 [Nakamurella sp.]
MLFGYPLTVPKRANRDNKILWVSRLPVDGRGLSIDAQLNGVDAVIHREVGFGGGQSIIDLPRPGCWRLTLRWGGGLVDVVDVPYEAAKP